MSEALILELDNPQYDDRLFIDLQLLTQKNTNSERCVQRLLFECQNKIIKQFLYTTCSELVFFWERSRKSMNNLLSYCGLTHVRTNPSEKDLPVCKSRYYLFCLILKVVHFLTTIEIAFDFFFNYISHIICFLNRSIWKGPSQFLTRPKNNNCIHNFLTVNQCLKCLMDEYLLLNEMKENLQYLFWKQLAIKCIFYCCFVFRILSK